MTDAFASELRTAAMSDESLESLSVSTKDCKRLRNTNEQSILCLYRPFRLLFYVLQAILS